MSDQLRRDLLRAYESAVEALARGTGSPRALERRRAALVDEEQRELAKVRLARWRLDSLGDHRLKRGPP